MHDPLDRAHALETLGLEEKTPSDLEPSAIERAYRGRLAVYRDDALASYSLMDDAERRTHLAEIEAAYKLLSRPKEAPETPPPGTPPSRPPPYDPAAPGASLRRAREHLRLGLEELASRTRIMRSHLIALEEENYATLPPSAYVRGFALQYARALGIEEAEALAQEIVARSKA